MVIPIIEITSGIGRIQSQWVPLRHHSLYGQIRDHRPIMKQGEREIPRRDPPFPQNKASP